ncbi:MAG TPA: sulfotransferase, partial [Acidimicrobiia bacterium]|nr:sulfotransferase [Acidimicrobiia bacterium]
EEDPTLAYEHYRQVVQILLWKNPVPVDGCLVLKCPPVAPHVGALARVFPEAHFVVTDRDPYRCVVSLAAMCQSILEPFCVDNPLRDDGARDRIALGWISPKLRAIGEFDTAFPERVTHVAYPDFVSSPAAVTQDIFAAAGFATDDGLGDDISAFLDAQRAGGRAAPPAELPTMGYTEDAVRSEPIVRDYCERFKVQPETARLVGVHGSR